MHSTAKDVNDDLGIGMLSVLKAHDYLVEHKAIRDEDADWQIKVTPVGRGEPLRGVYLRGVEETSKVQQMAVEVVPRFNVEDTASVYDVDLELAVTTSESWIYAPDFVAVNGTGRSFNIKVDPTSLVAGLHSGEIKAWQGDRLIFSIPVTVTKPELPKLPVTIFSHSFTSGTVKRHFVAVPEGATWVSQLLPVRSRT